MSNLDSAPAVRVCGGREEITAAPTRELLTSRVQKISETTEVRRLLPNLGRRMVGAWAFVDHYGPDDIADSPGMQVPPHPHMGLQTVSWLREGSVHHRDSTGVSQVIGAKELGLMTSGRGIAHSEQTPREHARFLHGAQLWVALPGEYRAVAPGFEHHRVLPRVTGPGVDATVILGALDGAHSGGTTYSPLMGADVTMREGASARLPMERDFEYAALTMSGECEVDGVRLQPGSMLYLGCGRRELPLRAVSDSTLILLGGEPFEEKIVMWWNFTGRSSEDITTARGRWNSADGGPFGAVHGYDGDRLRAPDLPPVALKPRGRVR